MEDDPLWKALKKNVKPLHDDHYVKEPQVKTKESAPSAKMKDKKQNPPIKKSSEDSYKDPPLILGERSKRVDRSTDLRIKKGKMGYQSILDFHGLTVDQAYHRFGSFLENAVRQKQKSILVITGKGNMLKGGGVIRQSFLRWVNEPVFSKHILSCHQSRPKDGGAGAFYLYLRG